MPLSDEIQNAAQTLGSLLKNDANLQEYLRLAAQALQDSEARELEARYEQLYQELSAREQNGQPIEQAEIDEYYDLKRQVQWHPILAARETQLELVRTLFGQAAQPLNSILNIDFPSFVL